MTGLPCAEVYDPENDRWTQITPMLHARREFGVGVIKDKLYVIGGYAGDLICCERYDTRTNTWSYIASK